MLKYDLTKEPTTASSANSTIPACELPKPISSSPQSIPSETSPRIFDLVSLKGSRLVGRQVVPTGATITFNPFLTFGAPQTLCKGSTAPIVTVVTTTTSAYGCCAHVNTSPTTKPSKPPGILCSTSKDSTSNPMSVRINDNSSGVLSICIKFFNQLYEILIVSFLQSTKIGLCAEIKG